MAQRVHLVIGEDCDVLAVDADDDEIAGMFQLDLHALLAAVTGLAVALWRPWSAAVAL